MSIFIILVMVGLFLAGLAIGAVVFIKRGSIKATALAFTASAESLFEKADFLEKYKYVEAKIKASYPIAVKIFGKNFVDKTIEKSVAKLQKIIGTTTARIKEQEGALEQLNEDIITKTKEFTAKTLSQNIVDREFFGDFTKASNEQVKEELVKILDSTHIDEMIASNLKKIKANLLRIKTNLKY